MTLWEFKSFEELTNLELFRMLELRTNIFVVEQNCPYPELDDADLICKHLLLKLNDQIIGTARIFPTKNYKSKIGRVCIHKDFRGNAYAHELMQRCIQECKVNGSELIEISAQHHLEAFYQSHQFKTVSEIYLEDGIPHIKMQLTF